MEGKSKTKVVRGWSLSRVNIEFLNGRANELSTPQKRVSASEVLDNLVTARRKKGEQLQARKKAGAG